MNNPYCAPTGDSATNWSKQSGLGQTTLAFTRLA